jgi:hypothetical protein
LDPSKVCELLERFCKSNSFTFHYITEYVATLVTDPTSPCLASLVDGQARAGVLVPGTESNVISASLIETYSSIDHLDDVEAFANALFVGVVKHAELF